MVILAPLAAVMFLSFRVQSMSVAAAQTTFWVYAGLVGLSLSSIFLVYTTASISQTFFATAAAFGVAQSRPLELREKPHGKVSR